MSNSIKGLDSLIKKLNRIGGNAEEVLTKSIGQQAKLVQGDAKDLCPVDTGDLRKSINTETKFEGNKIIGRVSTNSDHAAYVEFGTGRRGKESNTNTDVDVSYKEDWAGMVAQPYLYPALKNNEDRIIENIKEDVREAIREVSRR